MKTLLNNNHSVKSSFFLFVLLSLSVPCFSYDFAGGTGEPNNPYQIATAEQLLSIGSDPNLLNKCYILLNDIDLDPNVIGIPPFTKALIAPDLEYDYDFQGTPFTGSFDGNGKKIKNLKIDTAGAGNDFLGLFGFIDGSAAQVKNLGIENATITGGNDSGYLGGLCGYNSYGTTTNCYSIGQVTGGTGSYSVGGLCGYNIGTLSNCYATSSVTGGGNSQALGGLCGSNSGTISNSCATGCITSGTGSYFLGGLCGFNYLGGTLRNCYTLGSVTGSDNSVFLGGLCGGNGNGMIINCYSYCQVIGGIGSGLLGGLCGDNGDTIINCHANGQVNGDTGSNYLGGLCGANDNTIINCYATGSVSSGASSKDLGGLCGYNNKGTITNCYSNSHVIGETGSYNLGGLCGENYRGSISNCYAIGSVSGDLNKGGFCGYNYTGSFTGCFWDTQTSTMTDGVGNMNPDPNTVQGKTTAQMQTLSTFTDAGWDFVGEDDNGTEDIWRMCVDGIQYPLLTWQFSPDFVCPDGVDILDLEFFVIKWLSQCDQTNNFCNCTDTNYDSKVNFMDFAEFASRWLEII